MEILLTRSWSRSATRIGTLIVLLVGWGLLVYRLADAPPGFQHDQTFTSLDALQILGGSHPIYFPDNFGHAPLFMYSVAAVYGLSAGHYVWGLHLTAALWAMLALAITGALARRHLSRGGAVFAVALMAGSFWFLLAGRLGLEVISLVPAAAGMFYFLDRGLTERSWAGFASAGILGGVANYTYLASRSLYLVIVLLMLYATWRMIAGRAGRCFAGDSPQPRMSDQAAEHDRPGFLTSGAYHSMARGPVLKAGGEGDQPTGLAESGAAGFPHGPAGSGIADRLAASGMAGLLLTLAIMLLVSAPLLLYLVRHPAAADGRIGQLSGGILAALHGDLWPVARSAWDTVRSLLWRGSVALPYHYNVPGRPALQPFFAACLLLGLGLTLLRRRGWHTAVLLAALFAGLLPNLLTGADALYMRAGYTLPLISILVSRGLWAGGGAAGRLAGRRLPARWVARPGLVSLAVDALLAALLLWHVASSATAYFVGWAQAEGTQRIYNADFRAAVPFVDRQPADEQIFIGTDRLLDLDSATYRFYEPHRKDVNWFEAADSPPVPAQGSALYLLPTSSELPPTLVALEALGRDAFSIPAASGRYDLIRGFRLRAEDVAAFLRDRGSTRLAQPITYGDALRLDAAAFQDEGLSATLTTYWTALAAWPRAARPGYAPARPKFSLSLTGDGGYRWSQADVGTSLPFTTWQAGQHLLEISHLPLPGDLPPGPYSIRLTIYDDEGGPLPVSYGGRRVAADPVALNAELPARVAGAAPPPPYTAGSDQGTDGGLRLLGRWETLATLTAGVPTDLHLSWQATRPVDTAGLHFYVSGRGPDGGPLWEQSLPLGEPLPGVWPAGQVFRLSHRLLPRTPAPGPVEAQIEICAQDGAALLGCWQLGTSQVSNRPVRLAFPAPPAHPYAANWSGHVALAGYDVSRVGQVISLTLYWRAGDVPVGSPLKRFVHVTAADGSIIAQSDADFQADGVPAAHWQAGECVLDQVSLTLPPGRAPVVIYAGLYAAASGERLPVQLSGGAAAPDARVSLALPGDASP